MMAHLASDYKKPRKTKNLTTSLYLENAARKIAKVSQCMKAARQSISIKGHEFFRSQKNSAQCRNMSWYAFNPKTIQAILSLMATPKLLLAKLLPCLAHPQTSHRAASIKC